MASEKKMGEAMNSVCPFKILEDKCQKYIRVNGQIMEEVLGSTLCDYRSMEGLIWEGAL